MINIFITYFDEAGDDGYPAYSSPQFILSALYMKDENWKNYGIEKDQMIQIFNKELSVETSSTIMHSQF